MITIYKYPLSHGLQQVRPIPVGANIISVQMQDGVPCIWAIVDTTAEVIPVKFQIYGTGQEIPTDCLLKHIGSVQDGEYVWHVFMDDTVLIPDTSLRKDRI